MYRSENIGAGKQSAGRRVGRNFPSPMESFPWQGCVFFGGVFFSAEKIKVPDEEIFHGISVAGLRKNFGRDSASEWRHGAARKNLAGSAIGGGRRPTREILGLKKKVACRVWLVRCSLYVGEGASVPFSELAVTVHRP